MGGYFLGLRPDWDVLSPIVSVVSITFAFGGFGGLAQHLVLMLQRRYPSPRRGRDSEPDSEIGPKPACEPFLSGSLLASAVVGAASATGFTFFVIALLGMQGGTLDPVTALKLTSLSVIAGYAGRWLLSDMANHVSKQYVDKKMKEAEDAVGVEVRANQERVRAAAEQSARIVDLQSRFQADLEEALRNQKRLAEQLRRERQINQAQKEILALNAVVERLGNNDIKSDPAFRDTLLREAKPFLRTGPEDKLPRLWIDYARALRANDQFDHAIGCLKQFIGYVGAGKIISNINYINAHYNIACYYSLWSAQGARHSSTTRELRARALRYLKHYFVLAGFTHANRAGAEDDTDLDPLLGMTVIAGESDADKKARAHRLRVAFIASLGA